MPTAGRNPLNRLDERLFPTVDVLERPAAGLRGGAGSFTIIRSGQ
jgi:hypothetical protein